jgi:hypothetical protein
LITLCNGHTSFPVLTQKFFLVRLCTAAVDPSGRATRTTSTVKTIYRTNENGCPLLYSATIRRIFRRFFQHGNRTISDSYKNRTPVHTAPHYFHCRCKDCQDQSGAIHYRAGNGSRYRLGSESDRPLSLATLSACSRGR